jgi:hypothetical protein
MRFHKRLNTIKKELAPDREPGSKSALRQWYEISRIALTAQYTPSEYYLYDIHKKEKTLKDLSRYISNTVWVEQVWSGLTNERWDQILQNKWLYNLYYTSKGLPVSNVYGYLSSDGGLMSDGTRVQTVNDVYVYLRELQPETLVVKPICGGQGKFVVAFDTLHYSENDITGTGISGKAYQLFDVFDPIMKRAHRYSGFLMEEKVEQSEFMKKLNPFTTNTLRITTFLKKNGEPVLLGGIVRCGRKGSEVDNLSRGGFSRGIDVDTGYVRGYGLLSDKSRNTWITEHPDLHIPLERCEIPGWRKIVDTIKKFAVNTPFARMVGWDIIVTDFGPVFIEGNPDMGLDVEQSHSDGYLTDEFIADLKDLGVTVHNSFSRVRLGAMRRTLKRWM